MTDLKNTTVPSTGSWEEQKLKLKSKFSTLTDEDVAKVHEKILSELSEKLNANLRSN